MVSEHAQLFLKIHMSQCPEVFPDDWRSSGYLRVWSIFGFSSFTYAAAGCLMLTAFHGNYDLEPRIWTPLHLQGYSLIMQSFFTLMADVLSAGVPSIWHKLDRYVATFNTVFIFSNVLSMTWADAGLFLFALIAGIMLLFNARMARAGIMDDSCDKPKVKPSVVAYARWHSLWHLFFPSMIVLWLMSRQSEEYGSAVFYMALNYCLVIFHLAFYKPEIFHP